MTKMEAKFERWFAKEKEAGIGLTDNFEVGCLKAVAKAAYEAGIRQGVRRANQRRRA